MKNIYSYHDYKGNINHDKVFKKISDTLLSIDSYSNSFLHISKTHSKWFKNKTKAKFTPKKLEK